MNQELNENHKLDANGKPAGGTTTGTGIQITWQNGPLGRGEDRKAPNGAFVEGVISAAVGRLNFYQGNGFACEENRIALEHLGAALTWLNVRTQAREVSGVEGTLQK